ncbi:bacterio-opsin activator domain-containing protein [Haloplanus sp. C73]|uniref:bacterio-opsin activator domain-containing protein n=1 Tax=Haloplanus sp. C73 TaxID=3421641 RepID=UPI003EC09914
MSGNQAPTVEGLLSVTSDLLAADSVTEIAAAIDDAADDIVDDATAAVYLYRDDRLVPTNAADSTQSFDIDDDHPVPSAFRTDEPRWVDDGRDGRSDGVDVGERAVYPLDSHGVLVVSVDEGFDPSPTDRRLVSILSTNATAALRRQALETDLHEREASIRTLHTEMRAMLRAESRADIGQEITDAATTVLDAPAAAFLWDSDEGRLKATVADETTVATSTIAMDGGPAWTAFVDGETRRVAAPESMPLAGVAPTASELAEPIGHHGVVLAAPSTVCDCDVEVVKLLSANAELALDRAEHADTIHRQEARLQEQTERLARLDRINTTIRTILKDLVRADSKAEIQRAVCEELVAADHIAFAWVGHRAASGEGLHVDAWSGEGRGFLDYLLDTEDETGASPLPVRVAESGEVIVVDSVATSDDFAPWRGPAMNRGFRSVVCLPLSWNSRDYGFLELYGIRPDGFDAGEVTVLEELATTVANAINAVERKEALISGQATELELAVDDVDDPVFELARRTGCRLVVNGVVPRSDGSWLVYTVLPSDDPDPVVSECDRFVSIEDAEVIRSAPEQSFMRLTVSEFTLVETLGNHGATIQSVELAPNSGSVTVTVPPSTDVRSFVESCERALGEISLQRREQTSGIGTVGDLRYNLENIVTDKQFEALQTGFANGYFEVPREHTGEEIADKMGVSGPTFQHHIRKGVRRILGLVFDDGRE